MNFAQLVTGRRSVRQYTDEPLTPAEVETIMRAALKAPTSKNSRAWQFVLVENKEKLQELAACKSSGAVFLSSCALAIVVLTDPTKSEAPVEDGAIAATFIQLQAEDLGLGSCWAQVRGRATASGMDSEEYLRGLLNIPEHLTVACVIGIGHKAREMNPQNDEKLLWEQVHTETY